MSLTKLFDRIFWHNNTTPAINEDNLNAMSKALNDIDDRVIALAGDILEVVPQIQTYLDQAEDLVEAMENLSTHPPYIGANGNWYVWDTQTSDFIDSGIDASITVDIADVTMLSPDANPYVTNTGTNTDPIFHLFIPRGQTGNGIASIAKTATSGLVDTYTITFTNGTTTTFNVTNGSGDMQSSVYDPQGAVGAAGGIAAYAAKKPIVKTKTLTAGSINVTFTDIPTSGDYMIDFFTSSGINYTAINTVTAGRITLTFDAQSAAVTVYCRIEEV